MSGHKTWKEQIFPEIIRYVIGTNHSAEDNWPKI